MVRIAYRVGKFSIRAFVFKSPFFAVKVARGTDDGEPWSKTYHQATFDLSRSLSNPMTAASMPNNSLEHDMVLALKPHNYVPWRRQ